MPARERDAIEWMTVVVIGGVRLRISSARGWGVGSLEALWKRLRDVVEVWSSSSVRGCGVLRRFAGERGFGRFGVWSRGTAPVATADDDFLGGEVVRKVLSTRQLDVNGNFF